MKRDRIDRLLQLAYLEGKVRTRKAYEHAVTARLVRGTVSETSKKALRLRLEQALEGSMQQEAPLTVGAFLKGIRSVQVLRPQEIFTRLGITQNLYRMLEQDRISPLRISADSWKGLRMFFNIPANDLVEMIRRTHQLVFFRPSFRTTLARYDAKKNKAMKAMTLEKAATELYTCAQLSLPDAEKTKLEKLIMAISE